MRKRLLHIASAFLFLSLTFVFPVKYCHFLLDHEEKHEVHAIAGGEEELIHTQTHCDLCELVFALIIPAPLVSWITGSFVEILVQIPDYQLPDTTLLTYFLLRAPPSEQLS